MTEQKGFSELATIEAQQIAAFRAGFLKASWDGDATAELALAQSDAGSSITRLNQLASECGEPVATRIRQLAAQLRGAYLEGFNLGRAPGATYDGLWEQSATRKALYLEPESGLGTLCPGHLPKPGERWYITRDATPSTCQAVDVLDVTPHTVLVRPQGSLRDERLVLDCTRFVEQVSTPHATCTLDSLKLKYASKLNTTDMEAVVAEARRQLTEMNESLLKCILWILADRCATTVFHPKVAPDTASES